MIIKSDSIHSVISKLAHINTKLSTDVIVPTEIDRTPAKNVSPLSPFAQEPSLFNMCSASRGSKVLFATDEWFAAADNLLEDGPPIFDESLYCEQGKVMDGWESRRRREAGHDWCLIALAQRCNIVGVEIDTAHFTGNQVPQISLEMADLTPMEATSLVSNLPGTIERLLHGGRQGVGHTPAEVEQAQTACLLDGVEWSTLLAKTPLQPGYEPSRMHYFVLDQEGGVCGNYLRVNYFPDGGVARLRLWGTEAPQLFREPKPLYLPITTGKTCTVVPHSTTDSPPSRQPFEHAELSSEKHGGEGIACSNKHYGEPSQLIQETLGKDMGDGWETARHPDRPALLVKDPQTDLVDSPLTDWAVLKLGNPADGVTRILLDTKHFRGNYPESVLVEGCFAEKGMTDDVVVQEGQWFTLIRRTRLAPDAEHVFDGDLQQIENASRAVTHVRVSIFPDGGLSRVRIYGERLENDTSAMQSNL